SGAGLILAGWATKAVASTLLPTVDVSIDRYTVFFTLTMAVVASLLFGVLPTLHATRGHSSAALKESAPGFGKRRSRLQSTFVVVQVALSLVLLSTSGMFLDGLYRAAR